MLVEGRPKTRMGACADGACTQAAVLIQVSREDEEIAPRGRARCTAPREERIRGTFKFAIRCIQKGRNERSNQDKQTRSRACFDSVAPPGHLAQVKLNLRTRCCGISLWMSHSSSSVLAARIGISLRCRPAASPPTSAMILRHLLQISHYLRSPSCLIFL